MNTFLPGEASGSLPQPAAGQPAYRDRSTGLIVCGIVLLVLGGFAALLIPLILLGAVMAQKSGMAMPAGNYIFNMLSYALAAALFCTLGIGSIRARRWAWTLTLLMSWVWLIVGVFSTVLITAVLPSTFLMAFQRAAARNGSAQPLPTGVLAVILTFVIALFAIVLVVLPLIFVFFYRKKDVEETCKRRDPVERWTDHCPLPVLLASLLFACGGVYYFLLSITTPLFPFFGRYLTGFPAGISLIFLAVLDAYLAYSLFRLQRVGWWIAIAAVCVRVVSAGLTIRRANLLEAYSRMGWSQGQLEMMNSTTNMRSGIFLWWSVGFIVLFLGYLIWIRRYFPDAAAVGSSSTPTADQAPA